MHVIKDSFSYSDFNIGDTYQIAIRDWLSPTEELVLGEVMVRQILEPASTPNTTYDGEQATTNEINSLKGFLRVKDPQEGTVHLIAFDTIKAILRLEE